MCEHIKSPGDYLLNIRPDGKCRLCRHEIYKRHYENNKQKVLQKCADYRKKNPEKVKAIKAKYNQKIKMTYLGKHPKAIKELTKKELRYVNKLKAILYEIHRINREYNKHHAGS